MIYKLKAPFANGKAGRHVVKDNICVLSDKKVMEELCAAPFNFMLLEEIDEAAAIQEKEDEKPAGEGKGADADASTGSNEPPKGGKKHK